MSSLFLVCDSSPSLAHKWDCVDVLCLNSIFFKWHVTGCMFVYFHPLAKRKFWIFFCLLSLNSVLDNQHRSVCRAGVPDAGRPLVSQYPDISHMLMTRKGFLSLSSIWWRYEWRDLTPLGLANTYQCNILSHHCLSISW